MDYDLSRLGDKQFEHLAQALLVKFLGPQVSVFGAGPDGGREATWQGPVSERRLPDGWAGYGVAQAKFRYSQGTPASNASWLKTQIMAELQEWTKAGTRRTPLPDYFLAITNVTLSAVPGGGVDSTLDLIGTYSRNLGMKLKGFAVWHYDQIRALLDESSEIRKTYAAWFTPGDVLASLIDAQVEAARDLAQVLSAHAAKTLIDDRRLNLTQAGSVGDGHVGLADVFIDLPAFPPSRQDTETTATRIPGLEQPALEGIALELIRAGDRAFSPTALLADKNAPRASRAVIIGGPGQGKSTVGQFLCQIYRSAFLEGSTLTVNPEVQSVREAVIEHAARLNLPTPNARRWPVRVALSNFADDLAKGECTSVLDFVSDQLERRSGSNVSQAHIRSWLRSYPWLVVLDGLDEVPDASNRSQVMSAISDFLIDVQSVAGDVMVVATTRPQGYNNEFGRESSRHYELAPLPIGFAMKYGYILIEARLGAGNDRAEIIKGRLDRAKIEESSSRLLTTPLQVTILTLLLERLGHAPRDKWRLFSHYYRVIYQREQEKGTELAELLHTHEADVHFIHYRVGLLLQVRGERSGDTRGVVTKDEFTKLIASRLQSQGNSAEQAGRLAQRFVFLATERLVFLAAITSQEIGFEIRSLQEFMAAEAILAGPDTQVRKGLAAIAASSYWRNVLLFAVGKVFAIADREHFRAEVAALCHGANVDSSNGRATLPGSSLAAAILKERVTAAQPAYTRIFADCASRMLALPIDIIRGAGLLELVNDQEAWTQVSAALESASRGTQSQRATAISLLAAAADIGNSQSLARLTTIMGKPDSAVIEAVLRDDENLISKSLSRFIAADVARLPPSRFLKLLPSGEYDPEHLPPHARFLLHAIDPSDRNDSLRPRHEGPAAKIVYLSFNGLHSMAVPAAPKPVMEGSWALVDTCLEFCRVPTLGSLVRALEVSAQFPEEVAYLAGFLPWPLAACIEEPQERQGIRPTANRIGELARAAAMGHLGDEIAWRQAEERWKRFPVTVDELTDVRWAVVDGTRVAIPFDEQISVHGFPTSLGSSGMSHPESEAATAEFTEWVRQLSRRCLAMPPTPQRDTVANSCVFFFSVLAENSGSGRRGTNSVASSALPRYPVSLDDADLLLRLIRVGSEGAYVSRALVAAVLAAGIATRESELEWLGATLRLPENYVSERGVHPVGETFWRRWVEDPTKWRLGRLGLFLLDFFPEGKPTLPDEETSAAAIRCKLFAEAGALNRDGDESTIEAWLEEHLDELENDPGECGPSVRCLGLLLARTSYEHSEEPRFAALLALALIGRSSTSGETLVGELIGLLGAKPVGSEIASLAAL
ncbi:NACHT domain-containing protein [Actinoplanes sp. NPDC051513]|uniref:NACHT domain-containing protein n=1 Tax=Actinoplanes sp. NPDC051513 TaxID=3363908 RepID=UPI0037A73B7D